MKAIIFYYSQSGQALDIATNLANAIGEAMLKEIRSTHNFPYPWSRREFFDAFPETRLGMPPCGIEKIELEDVRDAKLVVIVGQSWFLSPSIPLQAFLEDEGIRTFMKGRKVVFVNGCRNMWLMTMHGVRQSLSDMGAAMVGHIVMQDSHANLVSVLTVIRWLFYGKKQRAWLLPDAGIKSLDITKASLFGKIIAQAITTNNYSQLQENLLKARAINYKPSVLFLERLGHRMFGLWAKFIRHKGNFGDRRRSFRCTLFMVYIITVLYIMSPFGVLFFWLTYPLRNITRQKEIDCNKFGMK